MVKETCKIGIIGGGSIGVTLAVALTSIGYDVDEENKLLNDSEIVAITPETILIQDF